MASTDNPIRTVTPFPAGSPVTTLIAPTEYECVLRDISAAQGSGRTEDYVMQKKRVGQSYELSMVWEKVTYAEAAAILSAFNPEYVTIEYLNSKAGTWVSDLFYITDRVSKKSKYPGIWDTVTIGAIQRDIDTV